MSDHRALTREEFEAGCGYEYLGVKVCDDEHGYYVYSYGHVPAEEYVKVILAFDSDMDSTYSEKYPEAAVQHLWAVTRQPADHPDGWWIEWGSEQTPGTFPVTVINR